MPSKPPQRKPYDLLAQSPRESQRTVDKLPASTKCGETTTLELEKFCWADLAKPLPPALNPLTNLATSDSPKFLPDPDTLARLLAVHETQPDAAATWKGLSIRERARAKRLGQFLDSDRTTLGGGHYKVDPALVLYLAWIIERVWGKQFAFSRPSVGGEPQGPMFELLMKALKHHISKALQAAPLLKLPLPQVPKKETVAGILKLARTEAFDKKRREFGFERTPESVAEHASSLRLIVAETRPAHKNRTR